MAISSFGYPGSMDASAWSKMSEELGQKYGCAGFPDMRVTPVVGVDRTVAVAIGTAFGRGVLDVNNAAVNVQLDVGTGANGTVRYDLIALRRTWGTTNATTVVKVTGTTSPTVPAGRLSQPGTADDQPLALVKITTGSTVPVIEADLRMWPSKVVTASDLRALVDPVHGDEAVVGGVRYRRVLDASSNPIWTPDSPVWTNYTPTISSTGSPLAMDTANRMGMWRKVGDTYEVEARFTWQRLGGGEGLGSGDYYFGLPFPANPWYAHDSVLGSASFTDVGVAVYGECNALLDVDAGSRVYFGYHGSKAGAAYPTVPNNGDTYSFSVRYRG